MAAPTRNIEPKVIDVNIFHVKPKYLYQHLATIPAWNKLVEKHGAKILGYFFVEGGNFGEIVTIAEYASMDARSKAAKEFHLNPEVIDLYQKTAHHIYGGQNYVCKANSHFPLKSFKSDGHILMPFYSTEHFPPHCMMKFEQTLHFMSSKEGAKVPPVLGVLHPLLYPDHGVFVLIEVPNNNSDEMVKNYLQAYLDPLNWPILSEKFHFLKEKECRLLVPIKQEDLPKLPQSSNN